MTSMIFLIHTVKEFIVDMTNFPFDKYVNDETDLWGAGEAMKKFLGKEIRNIHPITV